MKRTENINVIRLAEWLMGVVEDWGVLHLFINAYAHLRLHAYLIWPDIFWTRIQLRLHEKFPIISIIDKIKSVFLSFSVNCKINIMWLHKII